MWNKYIISGFFGWENAKWFIRNVQATFSNLPSYFARKRIESFVIFVNATVLLDTYCIKNMVKMSSAEMLAFYCSQMIYAGYQINAIRKDILTLPRKEEPSEQPSEEETK